MQHIQFIAGQPMVPLLEVMTSIFLMAAMLIIVVTVASHTLIITDIVPGKHHIQQYVANQADIILKSSNMKFLNLHFDFHLLILKNYLSKIKLNL